MKNLKGKYVIGCDTICCGEQFVTGENGFPALYDSKNEAMKEMFEDAISGLEGTEDKYFEENELDKAVLLEKMRVISVYRGAKEMEKFFEDNPAANYYDEFIVPAEEAIQGRKTIFSGGQLHVTGTKLSEI